MALSLANLRSAVSDQILTISGFHASLMAPDYFARQQQTLAHKSFAVQLGSSSALPDRQRRTVGVFMSTAVLVKFAYRLRPRDINTDIDLALGAEQDVINKVLASYAGIQNSMEIKYLSSSRTVPDSQEWIIHSINFQASHIIPT